MKIVVTGSRHWKPENTDQIRDKLLALNDDRLEIAHGASKGVDLFTAGICVEIGAVEHPFPVNSALDGNHRGAPLNRNKRMIETFQPDLVVGFRSSGKSNGTDHALRFAESLGIPTETIYERSS